MSGERRETAEKLALRQCSWKVHMLVFLLTTWLSKSSQTSVSLLCRYFLDRYLEDSIHVRLRAQGLVGVP